MNIITSEDFKKVKDFVELYEQYECAKKICHDNIYILEELILKQQKDLAKILSGKVENCECCNEKCNCCDEMCKDIETDVMVQCENNLEIDLSKTRYVIVQEKRDNINACHLFVDGNKIDGVQSIYYDIDVERIPKLYLTLL